MRDDDDRCKGDDLHDDARKCDPLQARKRGLPELGVVFVFAHRG
jgi:hypothetical protein